MFAINTWIRSVCLALAMLVFAAPATALTQSLRGEHQSQTRTTEATRSPNPSTTSTDDNPGSPEFGILLIIGVVGFLVFVAWLLTRVGDDGPSGDGSII